jgi:hypothetical protein
LLLFGTAKKKSFFYVPRLFILRYTLYQVINFYTPQENVQIHHRRNSGFSSKHFRIEKLKRKQTPIANKKQMKPKKQKDKHKGRETDQSTATLKY